jgi:hypothetical protein
MSAALQFATRSAYPATRQRLGALAELIADKAVLALLHELSAWPSPASSATSTAAAMRTWMRP